MADVDTFDVAPEFPVRFQHVRRGVATGAASGLIQRRQTAKSVSRHSSEATVRVCSLAWRNATWDIARRIEELHQNSFGGALTLTWTPPNAGSSGSFRMRNATVAESRQAANRYSIDVVMEEAI